MSDLNSTVSGVVGPVFSSKQSAISNAQSTLTTWDSTNGETCCNIIVGKLNSEPHLTNISNLFQNSASYAGTSSSHKSNRLSVTYSIESDTDITTSDHASLVDLTSNPERANKVSERVEGHYSGGLRFPRIEYTHTNGSNRKLYFTIMKFEA